jgi:hypothetical protein
MTEEGQSADWMDFVPHIGVIAMSAFGGIPVWASQATFRQWPNAEPSAHEFNCRKGRSLVVGADGAMSAAEIEVVRSLRNAGWNAGWLATCGRRNELWRRFMLAAVTPTTSVLPVALSLVPARIAGVLVRNGVAGYPDVVAWKSERRPVFVELKGPGDKGINQVPWLKSAFSRGDLSPADFLVLKWFLRPSENS